MKRKINRSDYRLLKKEFNYLEQTGHLESEQVDGLLSVYELTERVSFVRTILVIGSVLIGVGILSFIAGNWQVMSKLVKFSLLFIATVGFYIGGYKLKATAPRTSRSFYYIGGFVFGAGIFLIGQMFNLGGDIYVAFLMWGLGILPLAYYLKDKLIAAAATLFFAIYGFTVFDAVNVPYLLLILVPLLFWLNENRMGRSKGLFVANVLLALTFFLSAFIYFDLNEPIVFVLFFALGLFLAFYPFGHYDLQATWLGSAVYGISGMFLTFSDTWRDVLSNDNAGIASLIFTLLFIAILIIFLKIGSLPAILIVCMLIFRFYTDISYDFMPKSLFFVIGGLILIGFGFWFEKSRRGMVEDDEQKET